MLWDRSDLAALPEGVPMWRSMFTFPREELQVHLDEHGALNGKYRGPRHVDHLVVDLDGQTAIKDAEQIVSRLIDKGVFAFMVFASGGKGIHIHLHRKLFSDTLGQEDVKSTMQHHFGHFESFDDSIYHQSALIRMPYSIHQVTSRQVVPIEAKTLLGEAWTSLEDLYEYATSVWDRAGRPRFSLDDMDGDIAPLIRTSKPKTIAERERSPMHKESSIGKRIPCMQRLAQQGPTEGERHRQGLRLASWMRRNGVPFEMTTAALLSWSEGRDVSDTRMLVRSVYEQHLEYSCHDEVMDAFCQQDCIFYRHKMGIKPTASSFGDQIKKLQEFRRKILQGSGINLRELPPFSDVLKEDYWLLPGECLMVTGDTGMGKSSLVQRLIVEMQKKTLYLNLENSETLMTRRFIQIASGGIHKGDVYRIMDDLFKMNEVSDKLKHVYQVCIAPNLTELDELIKDYQPEVLVIDTTDVIEVPEAGNNEMYALKAIIERLRKIAARYEILVVGIHHINKASSKEGKMDLNSLSGNRANVTRMDHVIALKGMRSGKKRSVFTLKSRDNSPFSVTMQFDGARMLFSSVQSDEEEDPLEVCDTD